MSDGVTTVGRGRGGGVEIRGAPAGGRWRGPRCPGRSSGRRPVVHRRERAAAGEEFGQVTAELLGGPQTSLRGEDHFPRRRGDGGPVVAVDLHGGQCRGRDLVGAGSVGTDGCHDGARCESCCVDDGLRRRGAEQHDIRVGRGCLRAGGHRHSVRSLGLGQCGCVHAHRGERADGAGIAQVRVCLGAGADDGERVGLGPGQVVDGESAGGGGAFHGERVGVAQQQGTTGAGTQYQCPGGDDRTPVGLREIGGDLEAVGVVERRLVGNDVAAAGQQRESLGRLYRATFGKLGERGAQGVQDTVERKAWKTLDHGYYCAHSEQHNAHVEECRVNTVRDWSGRAVHRAPRS